MVRNNRFRKDLEERIRGKDKLAGGCNSEEGELLEDMTEEEIENKLRSTEYLTMDRVPGTGALRIGKSLQFNGDMFTLCYLSCLHNEHIFFH